MASDYVKQTWADDEAGGTPITAERLAVMEDGIAEHDHSGTTVPLPAVAPTAGQILSATDDSPLTTDWIDAPSGGAATASTLRDKYLKTPVTLYETCPRWLGMGTLNPSGLLILTGIALPAGEVLGRIAFLSSGANSAPTNWWMGLFNSSFNLLAVSANQGNTSWPANTVASLAIANTAAGAQSTFTTTYEGLYYLGVMQTATTAATLRCISGLAVPLIESAPVLSFYKTGVSAAPPTFPYTATAPTPNGSNWVYGFVGA